MMKNKILLFVLPLLLTTCSSESVETISTVINTSTPIQIVTRTLQPSLTLTPTLIHTKTLQASKTSTAKPTRTPQPTFMPSLILPSSSWTPLPTLNSDDAFQVVKELYENNGGCDLPCWWGITPGKTTIEDARKQMPLLYSQMPHFKGYGLISTGFSITVPEHYDPLGLGFFEASLTSHENIVFSISTNTGWIEKHFDYSLAGLLKRFGQPDEIWISMHPEGMNNKPPYDLDLFYIEEGIILSATGLSFALENSNMFCPQNFRRGNFPPAIVLFSPSETMTYQRLTKILFNREISHIFKFQLLRDLTDGFDEAEFYNTYSDPNDDTCIKVYRELLW